MERELPIDRKTQRLITGQKLLALLVGVAFAVVGVAWAFASPPGSSADEDFHLTSIWCAWGDHENCVRGSDGLTVRVPQQVAEADCFALQSKLNARCTWLLTADLVTTERVNPSTGVYPPLFYMTMRSMVGEDVARSVLIMRMINVAVAAALLAVALALAPLPLSRAVAVVWLVALFPIGIFYIASVNPSSWAITGVGLFWAFAWSWVRSRSWRSPSAVAAAIGAVICAVMAVGARSDSVLAIGLSVLAVAVLERGAILRRVPGWAVGVGLALVAAALAVVAWTFHVGDYLTRFTAGFPPGNAETDQPNPLLKTLLEVPAFIAGIFGGQQPWTQRESTNDWGAAGYAWHGFTYGVGSLDVTNPSIAAVLAGFCVAGVFFLGLGHANRVRLIVVAGLGAALLAQIVMMRALVNFGAWWSGGIQWALQPRYFWPLAIVILGIAVVRFPASSAFLSRVQGGVLAVLITIVSLTSLAGTMARYVHGQDHSWVQFDVESGWWWSWGLAPVGFLVVGGIAGVTYSVGMAILATRRSQEIAA